MIQKKADKPHHPLLIIGYGMESWRFCQQLVKYDVHKTMRIIVYGAAPLPAHDRVDPIRHFESRDGQERRLANPDWYAEHGIELETGTWIERIDPKASLAMDAEGREIAYSKCVLATGRLPAIPPIPDTEVPGECASSHETACDHLVALGDEMADTLALRLAGQQPYRDSGGGERSELPQEHAPQNWPDEAILCNCTRTTCGSLRALAREGCDSVRALGAASGAGTMCGSCLPQLAGFVGESAERFKDTASHKGGRLLLAAAAIAITLILAGIVLPPMPVADTVQSAYYRFSTIWQERGTKQLTGYTIAGLSAFALLLSARKRFSWLHFGNFGFWRAAHSWLGLATLAGVFMHTGLNFGDNLNRWLLICFLGLNLAGGLAAIALAAERQLSGPIGRQLRAYATKLHILFFLPYPVLLGFHIAKVYMY
ncbi:MAG: (2Fe-2S)-binding protein [Opitutales bacterium]